MNQEDQIQALLARARAGDRPAFDALMLELLPRLRSVIEARLGKRLRGHVEIEDLIQDVTLKAFESLANFGDQGEGSFLRWLVGIAEHRLLDLGDPRRRRPEVGIEADVRASTVSSSKAMRRDERFDRLKGALEKLSPEQREVIVLARIEGLPRQEIARRMSRSEGAVAQLLWRALKSLKTTFGDTESLHLPERSLLERDGDAKRIAVDHRTDIYSLGASLYEVLASRPPFEGKSYQDTLSQILLSDSRRCATRWRLLLALCGRPRPR